MAHGNHQVRIISGKWKGRKLNFPDQLDHNDLRPTSDRIRETLFNWIAPYISSATCLDAFAGSGVLGWEALSRGAQHCDFIDTSHAVKQNLIAQQTLLNAQNESSVALTNTLKWLQQPATKQFDIVFLDPPFRFSHMAQECINALLDNQWLKEGALVYIEQAIDQQSAQHAHLKTYRQQQAGQVQYAILKLTTD